MIKVFTTNKDGKIELTKDELKALLDEAYWDGYKANNHTYIYNTPSWTSCVCTTNGTGITLNGDSMSKSTISKDKVSIDTGNTIGGIK